MSTGRRKLASLSLEGGDGQQLLIAQNVVVLADNFRLSRPQYDLLCKGLTFIPTADRGREHQLQMQVDLIKSDHANKLQVHICKYIQYVCTHTHNRY